YDSKGELVWEMLLDVYGKVAECHGDRTLVPFRYQGQYEDEETGLYYNWFRYYSPKMGMYISSDPIGLAGNNPTLYGYVSDPNIWIDVFGLDCTVKQANKLLDEGATSLKVRSRSDAEQIFLDRYLGYKNTTGMNATEVKSLFGNKKGTYHWDDQIGPDGRVLGHAVDNIDGDMPHLQIHSKENGKIIRIFFPK
uniref:RHS repeat domain-containing protein n=1 Tax=Bacteroides fragilis TaxID=817 RepID=UPI0032EEA4DE